MDGAEARPTESSDVEEEGLRAYLSPGMLLIFVVGFLNYLDRYLLAAMIEPIKEDLNFSDTEIGILTGFAFVLFYATLGIPIARLADTKSRRIILATATASWSVMTALCGAAQNFWQMFVCRVGVGAGEAGGIAPAHSLIADYFEPRRRAGALAVFTASTMLGVICGFALGATIAEHWGWRAAFVILGFAGMVLAALVAVYLPEPKRRGVIEGAPQPSFTVAFRALMSRGAFLHIVIGFGVMSFSSYGMSNWTPSFLIRSHDLTLVQAGFFTGAVNGFGNLFAILLGGFLANRLMPRDVRWQLWLPAMTTLASIPGLFVFYAADSLAVALAGGAIGNFLVAMSAGPGLAAVQAVAGPHARALATGVLMLATSALGLGAGTILIGLISDHLSVAYEQDSLRYALLSLLFFPLWGTFHLWRASRTFTRDIARADAPAGDCCEASSAR